MSKIPSQRDIRGIRKRSLGERVSIHAGHTPGSCPETTVLIKYWTGAGYPLLLSPPCSESAGARTVFESGEKWGEVLRAFPLLFRVPEPESALSFTLVVGL